ncbi:MAG: hypothetical protein IJO22_02075 [Oscillospiraceae bacterium]|nr:hypothetical protein [Oscillospiraceae bacterium]
MDLYEKFKKLDTDKSLIGLEEGDSEEFAAKRQVVLDEIKNELGIKPLEEPFEYVKTIQAEFDYSKIRFTEEYYDVLGLEFPE